MNQTTRFPTANQLAQAAGIQIEAGQFEPNGDVAPLVGARVHFRSRPCATSTFHQKVNRCDDQSRTHPT
jgi:hypothetical protein